MTRKRKPTNRHRLALAGYEQSIFFSNPSYDSAIVGVSTDGRVIYDYDLMVADFMHANHCSYEDAVDFIEYNTIRSLPYVPNGPIVLRKLEEE